jgi:hypothetical protein
LRTCERLAQTEWILAIALTMPPEFRTVTRDNIARQSAAWRKLQRELKRRHGLFSWAWIREQKRGGNLHLHALIDCRLTKTGLAELAELAAKAGFGVIHLERTSKRRGGSKGAIGYAVKSLAYVASHKHRNWPRGTRLFGTSLPKLPTKRKDNFTWIANSDDNGDPLQPLEVNMPTEGV